MKIKFLILVLGAIFLSSPALAFDKYFTKYCKEGNVPVELAKAVARHESGLKPLCINVAGKDYQPKDRAEATRIIRTAQLADKSYDVGLMQINSQWVKQWKIDPVTLLDPETNIRLGVKLLREEIERNGLNWRAVGKYHSPNPLRGARYAGMVTQHIKGNAELKSKLSNPRLAGAMLLRRRMRMRDFKPLYTIDTSLIGQASSQRKPVNWKHQLF